MITIDCHNNKIDDERMYSFDYKFDNQELINIYNSISHTETSWPFGVEHYENKPDLGWTRRGWSFVYVSNRDKPDSDICNHPYIVELVDHFNFDCCAIYFFKNSKEFSFPIHVDGQDFRTSDGSISKVGEINLSNKPSWFPKSAEEYHSLRGTSSGGCKASINLLLSKEWSDDPNPQSVKFTNQNQVDWPKDQWHKSDNDYEYYYNTALLNTNWTHYLSMDGVHERLLFRISVYNQDFEQTKQRLKDLGL